MHIDPQWVIVALTVFTAILVPTLILMIRGAVKWTKVEDKLGQVADKIGDLVKDKDKTHSDLLAAINDKQAGNDKIHSEMLEQMRQDRDATDRRLRYIESFWMEEGRKSVYGRREDYEIHGTRTTVVEQK